MAFLQLSQTLADSFNALADEVQSLADTKTVLEHKLRFAHEQFQYLADKYAPAAPEIADTLANLQLPPHTSVDRTSPVPLPPRSASPPSQHQIAVVIRDGRRAASRLASLGDASKTTASSRDTLSRTSQDEESSMSTALEQDFTVQGKKGNLECPFSKQALQDPEARDPADSHDDPDDPICAMDEVTTNDTSAPGKCPIRFLDRHTPEEVARYVEMHKHELPRSHEVCLRRYQRSEEQVRKLDSKYGNIANLIEDLGQLHQPMLPETGMQPQSETDGGSNRRVSNWAEAVGASTDVSIRDADVDQGAEADDERQSHFDRPLKEVRVGESPSRPWGISVPIYDTNEFENNHVLSPPPAPVRMPSPQHSSRGPMPGGMPSMPPMAGMGGMAGMAKMMAGKSGGGKCPFDHTKLAAMTGGSATQTPKAGAQTGPQLQDAPQFTPAKEQTPRPPQESSGQPVFLNSDAGNAGNAAKSNGSPQMVFTGPVFIGYPMDQAIQFMNQYRPS